MTDQCHSLYEGISIQKCMDSNGVVYFSNSSTLGGNANGGTVYSGGITSGSSNVIYPPTTTYAPTPNTTLNITVQPSTTKEASTGGDQLAAIGIVLIVGLTIVALLANGVLTCERIKSAFKSITPRWWFVGLALAFLGVSYALARTVGSPLINLWYIMMMMGSIIGVLITVLFGIIRVQD